VVPCLVLAWPRQGEPEAIRPARAPFMFTFDVNCAPFTFDAHSDVAAEISARSRCNIAQRRTGAIKTAVEGGPRGHQGGEGLQINEGGFTGSCWTCGGCHRSDRCEIKWLRQLSRSIRRLAQGGRDESWLVHKARETVGQVRRMKTPGPTAIPIFELPRPREKTGGGGRPGSLAIRKAKRPRKRKMKTKTKTAAAQEQGMQQEADAAVERQAAIDETVEALFERYAAEENSRRRGRRGMVGAAVKEKEEVQQEEDSRWAAAKKKEVQQEEDSRWAAVKEKEEVQQEEDSRWAAAAGKEEADAAEENSRSSDNCRGRRGGMVSSSSERQDERMQQEKHLPADLKTFERQLMQLEKHLPANLKPFERQLVHEMAEEAGLSHESVGEGATRHIVLRHKTIFV